MTFLSRNAHQWFGAFLVLNLGLALLSSCVKSGGPDAGSNGKGTPAEAEQFVADGREATACPQH